MAAEKIDYPTWARFVENMEELHRIHSWTALGRLFSKTGGWAENSTRHRGIVAARDVRKAEKLVEKQRAELAQGAPHERNGKPEPQPARQPAPPPKTEPAKAPATSAAAADDDPLCAEFVAATDELRGRYGWDNEGLAAALGYASKTTFASALSNARRRKGGRPGTDKLGRLKELLAESRSSGQPEPGPAPESPPAAQEPALPAAEGPRTPGAGGCWLTRVQTLLLEAASVVEEEAGRQPTFARGPYKELRDRLADYAAKLK